MKKTLVSLIFVMLLCGLAGAQDAPPQAPGPPPDSQMAPPPPRGPDGGPGGPGGPGMGARTMGRGPGAGMRMPGPGKWWKNSALMQKIGVNDDQVQRIEKIFQEHRLQLIDLHAALEKQEVMLEPLVEADQPDEAQVISQIDKVAQARANLEKSNAQMLLAIRRVLTVEQWKKLRDMPGIAPDNAVVRTLRPGPPVLQDSPGPH